MGWLITLLLIAGGVVVYRYLTTVEAEIRSEIAATEDTGKPSSVSDSTTESIIISLVRARPGILQTDIYREFPRFDRKQIQKELLELDRSGRISRRKFGNTYQLSALD